MRDKKVLKHMSQENLKNNSFSTPTLIRKSQRFIPNGFTKDISCVENPFKIENACEGDSGSPVVR
jgi:hypothetical protein